MLFRCIHSLLPIKLPKTRFIFFIAITCLFQFNAKAQTTQGTDFWLTPMINYIGATDSFFVIVSAEKATNAKIEIPLQGFSASISLGYNDLIKVYIPNNLKPQVSDTTLPCGIHVTSYLPVSVYSLSARSATTDASCIFPTAVQPKGGSYFALTPYLYTGGYNSGNTIGIVGIDDSALVEIVPAAQTKSGYTAGKSFFKKILKGEVYLFTSQTNTGLEGTFIKAPAGKRIAVFGGDICVAIRCAACDHVYEEIPPAPTLGKSFIVTGFFKQDKGHDYQIVATENNTTIWENGSIVANLNAGKVFYRKVLGDTSLCVTADKPVLLAQYMIGKSCGATIGGDPAMLVINPLEQTIKSAIVSTSNTTLVKTHYINIIVPKSAIDSVYLDGNLIPNNDFEKLSCGNYYSYRDSITAGNHRIECRFGFICYLYGIGTYESYAYSAGSGLRNLKRFIIAESFPSCDSGFVVKLTSGGDSATRFKWQFNGQTDTTKSPYFVVNTPGTYPVKLLYKPFGFNTWDSTALDVLIEKPQYSDYITFDSKTVCAADYKIELPNTPIFSYKWNTGDTTSFLIAKTTGKYSVNIRNRITGCSVVDSCYIKFFNAVNVKMAYKMSSFCPGIPLYLYDSSTTINDTIISRSWYADKYYISDKKNDTIKSPRANNYEIKLVLKTSKGCIDSSEKNILISDIPIAVTGITKYDTCYGTNKFRFNNGSYNSLGRINRFKWLLGDGDTSGKQQPFKSYADSGTYKIQLIAFSETGCFDTSDAKFITVYPKPKAGIQIIDSAICRSGNFFNFQNGTVKDNRPMKYLWDWGDGSGSTFENPGNIAYYDTGIFNIRFVASFAQTGCGDTAYRKVKIIENPKAALAVDSFNFCLNRNYYQLSSNGNPNGGSPETTNWVFSDGTQITNQKTVKKAFPSSGTFNIKMYYSTGKGCIDSVSKNVVVYNSPVAAIGIIDSSVCGPNNYFNLNNNSTAPNNARWYWDFNNGNTSTTKNPGKINYSSFGTFKIMLAVKDPLTNCTDTAYRNVSVLKSPLLNIKMSDTSVCTSKTEFTFTDSTIYGNVPPNRRWAIGNSKIDTNQIVKKTFTAPGYYQIQFRGGMPGICADTANFVVSVRYTDTPASIKLNLSQVCAPASSNFIATINEGNKWTYLWEDAATARSWNTQNTNNVAFNQSGYFPIHLKIIDDIGCEFNYTDTLSILPKPTANITITTADSQCLLGNNFAFSAAVLDATYPYSFNWNLSDSKSSTDSIAKASYSTSGSKSIVLELSDANNCKDTALTSILTHPMPDVSVTGDSGCLNETRLLNAQVLPSSLSINSVTWYRNALPVFIGNPYLAKLSPVGTESIFVVAKSSNNCVDTSNTAFITTFPKPTSLFGTVMYTATGLGIPVDFIDSSIGATQWTWSPEPGISAVGKSYSYLYPRTGWVNTSLIVSNANGCLDTSYKSIELLSGQYGWVPSSFSPNGDGRNDFFKIEGLSAVNEFELIVYNRWGEKIFSTTNPEEGWNGDYMGSPALTGVYAYRINLIFFTGKRQAIHGEVTLLR
ncbi:MAG: gliding motility-associated C-terminal domain-containing protein [Bacteroidia bacterium]|nr:gliding motility-associated C-terminal domain-containing protein [Bacteroidia bacterium]